jgi:NADPH2:quinone reductase
VEIDPRNVMVREATILGMTLYNADSRDLKIMHAAFVAGLEDGTLRPVVSKEIPLAKAATAYLDVTEASTLGNIVMLP